MAKKTVKPNIRLKCAALDCLHNQAGACQLKYVLISAKGGCHDYRPTKILERYDAARLLN